MSDRTALRVVSGSPTAEELAVVAALVTAVTAPDAGRGRRLADRQRGRWNDPAALLQRPLSPGPGGWRAAAR
jgi:hypothetical protein